MNKPKQIVITGCSLETYWYNGMEGTILDITGENEDEYKIKSKKEPWLTHCVKRQDATII